MSLLPPPVYPSNWEMLPTKIRPVSPCLTSLPFSSISLTIEPRTTLPTVLGSARRSSGVAIVAYAISVDPYRL